MYLPIKINNADETYQSAKKLIYVKKKKKCIEMPFDNLHTVKSINIELKEMISINNQLMGAGRR